MSAGILFAGVVSANCAPRSTASDIGLRPTLPRLLRNVAVLLALVASTCAYGWGKTGHSVICQIAYLELTPKAKHSIDELMTQDSSTSSFAQACNWADEPAQRNKRKLDHFINVPRFWYEIRGEECRIGDRCLFTAIRHDVNVLSYQTDSAQRLAALKYLGHWVGDIHQPLHVSFNDDRWGNSIKQEGGLCDGSLHSVWDTCIIKRQVPGTFNDIAATLQSKVTVDQRALWTDSTLRDWADESFKIARDFAVQYCSIDDKKRCWYGGTGNHRFDLGEEQRTVVIDSTYLKDAQPKVEERLVIAGVRLGALLNRLFDAPDYE